MAELNGENSVDGQLEITSITSLGENQKDLISRQTADAVSSAQQEKSGDELVYTPSIRSKVLPSGCTDLDGQDVRKEMVGYMRYSDKNADSNKRCGKRLPAHSFFSSEDTGEFFETAHELGIRCHSEKARICSFSVLSEKDFSERRPERQVANYGDELKLPLDGSISGAQKVVWNRDGESCKEGLEEVSMVAEGTASEKFRLLDFEPVDIRVKSGAIWKCLSSCQQAQIQIGRAHV